MPENIFLENFVDSLTDWGEDMVITEIDKDKRDRLSSGPKSAPAGPNKAHNTEEKGEGCGGETGIKPSHIPPLGFVDPFFLHLFDSEVAEEGSEAKEGEMAGRAGNWQMGAGRGGYGGRGNFSSGRNNSPPGRNFGRFEDRNQSFGNRREGNFIFGEGGGRGSGGDRSYVSYGRGSGFEDRRDVGAANSGGNKGRFKISGRGGDRSEGSGSGHRIGEPDHNLKEGSQGNQGEGKEVPMVSTQNFPEIMLVGLGLGQMGFLPPEQMAQHYQYLLANVPKGGVPAVPHEEKETSDKGSGNRNEGGHGKEAINGKCKESGHVSKDCRNNVFCVVCQRVSHQTEDCTILKQPKPVAKYVGYGSKGLGSLLVQNTKEISAVEHANPMAIITVSSGVLNETTLVQGLARMLDWRWTWRAKFQSPKTFLVRFPNKAKLVELKNFGAKAVIEVDFWSPDDKAKGKLHSIWIQMHGVPDSLRHFLGIALGQLWRWMWNTFIAEKKLD